jgi:hypothetical protein
MGCTARAVRLMGSGLYAVGVAVAAAVTATSVVCLAIWNGIIAGSLLTFQPLAFVFSFLGGITLVGWVLQIIFLLLIPAVIVGGPLAVGRQAEIQFATDEGWCRAWFLWDETGQIYTDVIRTPLNNIQFLARLNILLSYVYDTASLFASRFSGPLFEFVEVFFEQIFDPILPCLPPFPLRPDDICGVVTPTSCTPKKLACLWLRFSFFVRDMFEFVVRAVTPNQVAAATIIQANRLLWDIGFGAWDYVMSLVVDLLELAFLAIEIVTQPDFSCPLQPPAYDACAIVAPCTPQKLTCLVRRVLAWVEGIIQALIERDVTSAGVGSTAIASLTKLRLLAYGAMEFAYFPSSVPDVLGGSINTGTCAMCVIPTTDGLEVFSGACSSEEQMLCCVADVFAIGGNFLQVFVEIITQVLVSIFGSTFEAALQFFVDNLSIFQDYVNAFLSAIQPFFGNFSNLMYAYIRPFFSVIPSLDLGTLTFFYNQLNPIVPQLLGFFNAPITFTYSDVVGIMTTVSSSLTSVAAQLGTLFSKVALITTALEDLRDAIDDTFSGLVTAINGIFIAVDASLLQATQRVNGIIGAACGFLGLGSICAGYPGPGSIGSLGTVSLALQGGLGASWPVGLPDLGPDAAPSPWAMLQPAALAACRDPQTYQAGREAELHWCNITLVVDTALQRTDLSDDTRVGLRVLSQDPQMGHDTLCYRVLRNLPRALAASDSRSRWDLGRCVVAYAAGLEMETAYGGVSPDIISRYVYESLDGDLPSVVSDAIDTSVLLVADIFGMSFSVGGVNVTARDLAPTPCGPLYTTVNATLQAMLPILRAFGRPVQGDSPGGNTTALDRLVTDRSTPPVQPDTRWLNETLARGAAGGHGSQRSGDSRGAGVRAAAAQPRAAAGYDANEWKTRSGQTSRAYLRALELRSDANILSAVEAATHYTNVSAQELIIGIVHHMKDYRAAVEQRRAHATRLQQEAEAQRLVLAARGRARQRQLRAISADDIIDELIGTEPTQSLDRTVDAFRDGINALQDLSSTRSFNLQRAWVSATNKAGTLVVDTLIRAIYYVGDFRVDGTGIWSAARDSIGCVDPQSYHPRFNTDGPWTAWCLLKGRLPPAVPAWPVLPEAFPGWSEPCPVATVTATTFPFYHEHTAACHCPGYTPCSQTYPDAFHILPTVGAIVRSLFLLPASDALCLAQDKVMELLPDSQQLPCVTRSVGTAWSWAVEPAWNRWHSMFGINLRPVDPRFASVGALLSDAYLSELDDLILQQDTGIFMKVYDGAVIVYTALNPFCFGLTGLGILAPALVFQLLFLSVYIPMMLGLGAASLSVLLGAGALVGFLVDAIIFTIEVLQDAATARRAAVGSVAQAVPSGGGGGSAPAANVGAGGLLGLAHAQSAMGKKIA